MTTHIYEELAGKLVLLEICKGEVLPIVQNGEAKFGLPADAIMSGLPLATFEQVLEAFSLDPLDEAVAGLKERFDSVLANAGELSKTFKSLAGLV